MQFNTKFNIGDEVFCIQSAPANHQIKCTCCKEVGTVNIDGIDYQCPKCKGNSKHLQNCGYKWYVIHDSARVGKIRAEFTGRGYINRDDDKLVHEYMIDTTGIGTGTIWKEDTLYASREEAEAECARRNANLPEGASLSY